MFAAILYISILSMPRCAAAIFPMGSPAEIDAESLIYLQQVPEATAQLKAQQIELSRRAREGDIEAYHQLILSQLRLVIRIAKRSGNPLPLEDRIGEGNVAIVFKALAFDPERDTKYSTYVSWQIKGQIQKAGIRASHILRVRREVYVRARKYLRIFEESRLTGEILSIQDFMERMGLKPTQLLSFKRAVALAHILHWSYLRRGEDPASTDPQAEASFALDRSILSEAFSRLEERDQFVLRMRYGLGEVEILGVREIGEILGVTYQRVVQIQRRAEQRLRLLIEGEEESEK